MSDVPARPGPSSSRRWLPIYALLAPAIILPLWVALYDREDPTLFGFPFFFWFQFALILLAVALTLPAYFLAVHADRHDRVRHGLPPVPDGTGTDRKAGDER
jgi:Protein of unknown function (DUF3311)